MLILDRGGSRNGSIWQDKGADPLWVSTEFIMGKHTIQLELESRPTALW